MVGCRHGSYSNFSFVAAVFSNTGILGGVLYFGFVAQILLRKKTSSSNREYSILLRGVRYAYIPGFIVAILVGTTADFGSYNAALYGLALAFVSIPNENKLTEATIH